jgi:hypothetical protein
MANKRTTDVLLGTIDGIAPRVARAYGGTLSKGERASVLRVTADYVTDVLRIPPEDRGTGVTPEISVTTYRRELSDLLWLSLTYGFQPVDLAETCRAVGDALGIERHEIRDLISELGGCVERYREIADGVPEAFRWGSQ